MTDCLVLGNLLSPLYPSFKLLSLSPHELPDSRDPGYRVCCVEFIVPNISVFSTKVLVLLFVRLLLSSSDILPLQSIQFCAAVFTLYTTVSFERVWGLMFTCGIYQCYQMPVLECIFNDISIQSYLKPRQFKSMYTVRVQRLETRGLKIKICNKPLSK